MSNLIQMFIYNCITNVDGNKDLFQLYIPLHQTEIVDWKQILTQKYKTWKLHSNT